LRPGQYIRTEEHRQKSREINLGKKLSDEHKEKIRQKAIILKMKPPVMIGENNPNWKGGKPKCIDCGRTLSEYKYTRCCSCARKGELNPYRIKILKENGMIGKYDKIKLAIRNSYKYRQWRSDVLTRDKFTCQECFSKEKLETHHILSLTSIIREYKIETIKDAYKNEKLFDINNGLTLCSECHKKTDNYKGKNNKFFNRNKENGRFIKST